MRRLLHSLHEQVEFLCAQPHAPSATTARWSCWRSSWPAWCSRSSNAPRGGGVRAGGVFAGQHAGRPAARRRALRAVDRLPPPGAAQLAAGAPLAADNGVPCRHRHGRALRARSSSPACAQAATASCPACPTATRAASSPLLQQGHELYGREDMRCRRHPGARAATGAHARAFSPDSRLPRAAQRLGQRARPFATSSTWCSTAARWARATTATFDCLSFELAAGGRSLVVDPAATPTARPARTNWRVHFRGTAAHNTVCVDGRNQTRYEPKADQGRHAPRARLGAPQDRGPGAGLHADRGIHGDRLDLLHGRCASHEYDAVHDRCIVFVDRRYWIVADTLRAGDCPRLRTVIPARRRGAGAASAASSRIPGSRRSTATSRPRAAPVRQRPR
jgi:hypothetical protein